MEIRQKYLPRVSTDILFVLLCQLIAMVQTGKYVYQTTTSDNTYYFLNDLGVKVTGNSPLTFDLKTCQDGLIRFAETKDLLGNYYDIVLGAGSNSWSGLRNRCGGCGVSATHWEAILNCTDYKTLWVMWDGSGSIELGTGSDVGDNVILSFTDTSPFEIHYIAVASYFGVTGEWKILIDEMPVFSMPVRDGSTVVSVSEETVSGEIILNIAANDPENDKLTFSIPDNHGGQFEIVGTNLKLSKQLDFETTNSYSLIISVSDDYNEVNVSMTVDVVDECDETPEVHMSTVITIPEEMPRGTLIGPFFTVTDRDENDPLVFTLLDVDSSYFLINSSTGDISILKRIDRDGGLLNLDQLTMNVSDSCGHSTYMNINISVIDLNDNPPVCETEIVYASIAENSSAGTIVTSLNVTDSDCGNNAVVSLTIVDGDDPSNPVFTLSGTEITADGGKIDYEASPSDHRYVLTIHAVDNPDSGKALTGTCIVIVSILPENDHAPVWTKPTVDPSGNFPGLSIAESQGVSTSLLTLRAVDQDEGRDGDLEYSIVSITMANGTTTTSTFHVDNGTGLVQTTSTLDRDIETGGTEYFDVVFSVKDKAQHPRIVQGKLRVSLTDVNDNPPELQGLDTVHLIHCNMDVGDVITQINVTDVDSGKGKYVYLLVHSQEDIISLNDSSGEFSLKTKLGVNESLNFPTVVTVTEDRFSSTFVIRFQMEKCLNSSSEISTLTTPFITTSVTSYMDTSTTEAWHTSTTGPSLTSTTKSAVKSVSELNNIGLIETWSLRVGCGVLGLALVVTYTVIVIRCILSSSPPSRASIKENKVAPTTVSPTSQSECKTEITTCSSIESLDYFE